ncbi:hypothetical protein [Streptomyces violascens]|uniref:hypothetical protein n=1 Tax=Streptomyces violascens TaxID=67381 RepID=UPI0036849766
MIPAPPAPSGTTGHYPAQPHPFGPTRNPIGGIPRHTASRAVRTALHHLFQLLNAPHRTTSLTSASTADV